MKRVLKKLAKAAYTSLLPRGARNSLRLFTLLHSPDFAPRMIESFDSSSVLVLAPHMDDEVIGCGGTLRRHVLAGGKVKIVFTTDGSGGDKTLPANQIAAMIETRKEESRRATAMLGISDLTFLDGPDGSLSELPPLVERLRKTLKDHSPAVVYLPSLTDNHRDHWATNRILHAALDAAPAGLLIRGYEIWSPAPANVMVDITDVAELKRRAIEAFASQTKFVSYDRIAMGLAAYRSMMHLFGKGYAEAYLETTVAEYRKLYAATLLKSVD